MFQHLFGKWKVWQVLALMMLVVMAVLTASLALAGTTRGGRSAACSQGGR